MAGIRYLFHSWILQHRICVAGSHLFYDSTAHGCFRRRQGILQQLLWARSAFPANRKHPRMVAQEGGTKMALISMVSSWIPAVLHVLLYPDGHPHCDGGKGRGESPSDHSPTLDL